MNVIFDPMEKDMSLSNQNPRGFSLPCSLYTQMRGAKLQETNGFLLPVLKNSIIGPYFQTF
jgi:hypothetical protein